MICLTVKTCQNNRTCIAHFEKEWWPGSRVAAQAIVGRFGGRWLLLSSPQTIPQSLGQLLSTQAITHFQSGLLKERKFDSLYLACETMLRFLETTNITYSYVHEVSFCIASRLSVFTQAVYSLFDYRWRILQLRGGKLPECTLFSSFVLYLFQLV